MYLIVAAPKVAGGKCGGWISTQIAVLPEQDKVSIIFL
jgi:hypothetical protein